MLQINDALSRLETLLGTNVGDTVTRPRRGLRGVLTAEEFVSQRRMRRDNEFFGTARIEVLPLWLDHDLQGLPSLGDEPEAEVGLREAQPMSDHLLHLDAAAPDEF